MDIDKRCAPGITFSEGSCYSLESLIKIAYAYNSWILNNNIDDIPIKIKHDKQYLINCISSKINNCSNQKCWLNQPFASLINDENITQYTFRPDGPQGQFTWLSTTNIIDIMSQYEHQYKDFLFLGAVPIDFYSLRQLNIPSSYNDFDGLYKNDFKKIGIVFNLDEHWQTGSHWTASYVDFDKKQVYYYDSISTKPERRIKTFLAKCIKFICKIHKCNIDLIDISHNPLQHQYGNSECGVYSCNFIIRLLNGENYHDIIVNKLSDDSINQCRKVYFSNLNF